MPKVILSPEDYRRFVSILPLDQINPAHPRLMTDDVWGPVFKRLRDEAPLHYCEKSPMGPFWSITRHQDIVATELNTQVFSSSSAYGGIALGDRPDAPELPMFIAMDRPMHTDQRKVVQPIVSSENLINFEGLIRYRTQNILDGLPRQKTFNWVDEVSIPLTTMMLATLLDFPFEERAKLAYWSDCATANVEPNGLVDSERAREKVFKQCLEFFGKIWMERARSEPRPDLISMLAHGQATRNMSPRELLGNLLLLIVGGNDTTRNSMTASVSLLDQNPREYDKLRANPALIDSMVPEVIRYHSPVAYMRRTALEDFEMHGRVIRKGDKVAMWYVSGNRDERVIDEPDAFVIDRERPRRHLSFGFGIHRCLGDRLAELQLKILWEEALRRFSSIEVVGEAKRLSSSFVRGFSQLLVRVAA